MTKRTFRCGHPKTPENIRWGHRCGLCERVYNICRQQRRDQVRINRGTPLGTLGQQIANGTIQ